MCNNASVKLLQYLPVDEWVDIKTKVNQNKIFLSVFKVNPEEWEW